MEVGEGMKVCNIDYFGWELKPGFLLLEEGENAFDWQRGSDAFVEWKRSGAVELADEDQFVALAEVLSV